MSHPTSTGKRTTRQLLASRRDAMSPEARAHASRLIADRVNALVDVELPAGSVLALYAAKGSEVETDLIDGHARARGLRVVYPRVVDGQRALAFHEVAPAALVVAGRFGLREPLASAPQIALADVTAFVVPGLAFDRDGGRLGWGRGHYDATLDQVPAALRIGVGFDCQLVERLVHEPHDVPLHLIVTEVATYQVA